MKFLFSCLIYSTLFLLAHGRGAFICDALSAINHPKTINIIANDNGVGLTQDVEILRAELTRLGYEVRCKNGFERTAVEHADVNIFLETGRQIDLPKAAINVLIPNPEWCGVALNDLEHYDIILCKTKEAERIYRELASNLVLFMGFTCMDRYQESVLKDYHACFHLAGKSMQKGTGTVVKAWLQNPHWPHLTLVKHKTARYENRDNVTYLYGYLPFDELTLLQNQCGIHLCPSETEGFGHYIMEALSCGAVVVTTDGPPMNEFMMDPRCLIGYERTRKKKHAVNYYVDLNQMESLLSNLFSLSEEELMEMGQKNREFYLENDRQFKERFAEIFTQIITVEKTF
jgi:hypothetical protein